MDNCVFCKIVRGEITSYKIFDGGSVMAFLDIAPVNYGHTLVIPKDHYANLEELPNDLLCEVISVVKKVGESLKSNYGVTGYNVNMNNDPVAGQVVPHIHFHCIPRRDGDGLGLWPGGRYGDGEAEEVLEKIRIK